MINTEVLEGTVPASPAPIQEPLLSIPVSDPTGKVSKSVSNNGSVAAAPSPNECGGSKTVWTDADVDREIGPDQLGLSAEDQYHELFPSKLWSDEDIDMLIDLAKEVGGIRGITHGGETIRRSFSPRPALANARL